MREYHEFGFEHDGLMNPGAQEDHFHLPQRAPCPQSTNFRKERFPKEKNHLMQYEFEITASIIYSPITPQMSAFIKKNAQF